jgi:TonB family protein
MPLRKLGFIVVLAVIAAPAMCLGSVESFWMGMPGPGGSLAAREAQLWAPPVRDSEFATMQRSAEPRGCEATRPPEALATPNPLLESDASAKIRVSFIIGTDGRVYSPLILESAGAVEDRTVLDAVRSWRYRPAMCNGVPTEAEAKIEFSSQ